MTLHNNPTALLKLRRQYSVRLYKVQESVIKCIPWSILLPNRDRMILKNIISYDQ